jgi:hypothetical protein
MIVLSTVGSGRDNQSVVVDVKRRRCSCGQFVVLLFGDLIVASYVRQHYNGDWVFL